MFQMFGSPRELPFLEDCPNMVYLGIYGEQLVTVTMFVFTESSLCAL
jgi:hypothetical protein